MRVLSVRASRLERSSARAWSRARPRATTRPMPSRLPPFESDLACASTLPAFTYTHPEILSAEREKIFRRTWQPIGCLEDVRDPGSFLTGDIDGAPIVVTRDQTGTLRAFHNVC